MINRIHLFSCYSLLRCLALFLSIIAVTVSCSSTPPADDVVSDQSPEAKQWYQCQSKGGDWDCGSPGELQKRLKQGVPQAADNKLNNSDFLAGSDLAPGTGSSARVESEPKTNVIEPDAIDVQETAEGLYTVQIGAFPGESKRDDFIEENNLQSLSVEFYESTSEGRVWWVLTHGEFSDINAANAARISLNQDYGLDDTWVRPLYQLKPQPEILSDTASKEKDGNASLGNQRVPAGVALEDFYDPHYSIQIAAFRSEKQIAQFVEDKGLSELELTYIEENREGVAWWIILYGKFELVADARPEQKQIESEFGLADTWIRPVQN